MFLFIIKKKRFNTVVCRPFHYNLFLGNYHFEVQLIILLIITYAHMLHVCMCI